MIHIVSKGYKFIQTQIDDFCGVIVSIVITRILSIFQTKLTDFIDDAIYLLKRKIKLPYKTKPVKVTEEYLSGKISDDQKIAFQEYPGFHGYLNNIFRLNPSVDNFFRDLQLKLGYKPQNNHDFLNLNNIFKIELTI